MTSADVVPVATSTAAVHWNRVRAILDDVDDATNLVRQSQANLDGEVRVVASTEFATHQLAGRLPHFHAACPEVVVKVTTAATVRTLHGRPELTKPSCLVVHRRRSDGPAGSAAWSCDGGSGGGSSRNSSSPPICSRCWLVTSQCTAGARDNSAASSALTASMRCSALSSTNSIARSASAATSASLAHCTRSAAAHSEHLRGAASRRLDIIIVDAHLRR
jgi:hypothetical protein